MNLCLTIDTSLYGTALALSDLSTSEVLEKGFHKEKGRSDTAIGTLLEAALKRVGLPVSAISHLVVSQGPGSFTGIKVGLAWAYGFCLGQRNCQILGLSSLREAVIELARERRVESLSLLFPISRREAFLCRLEHGEVQFVVTKNFLEEPAAQFPPNHLLAGEEVSTLLLAGEEVPTLLLAEEKLMSLALEGLLRRTNQLGVKAFGLQLPEPIYMKKSTVEEKLIGRK